MGCSHAFDSIRPFPWNMTLGAIQDNALVEAVGKELASKPND